MSFQTLPLPPALHYLLFPFTCLPPWSLLINQPPSPVLPLYQSSPPKHSLPDCLVCKPSSPASSDPDPEPACLCIDLPFWTLDLPFACSYRIDLPAWTLDLPCCLPLGINTISSPELFPVSCYWVLVCHWVKPDRALLLWKTFSLKTKWGSTYEGCWHLFLEVAFSVYSYVTLFFSYVCFIWC